MEDRYEIKGKVGQGGLGTVYRANDLRMNREVAIKRIITDSEDQSISKEATRQLIKEAGALASLQHPNIVTIYDVGSDEDGPFVVMELLTGETLEDIITRSAFVYDDFRQLAKQTLEALIAAQEMHFVHRDLKPSNIMLSWLPSGKFQIKIVDFGLAKLSATPSLQTIDQSDGVFGSIYFMAPEQFERALIDLKTDLYAIGCVFYYALTGLYPFDGANATEVMISHLQHHVTPISEIREGIPLWLCEWVMWHLNRNPSDRPESARQALQFFVENEIADPDPELSLGRATPAAPISDGRPKLKIPGVEQPAENINETTSSHDTRVALEAKPLSPPQGSMPSVHTSRQAMMETASITALAEENTDPIIPDPVPEPPKTAVKPISPQPAAAEPGTKINVVPAKALTPPKSSTVKVKHTDVKSSGSILPPRETSHSQQTARPQQANSGIQVAKTVAAPKKPQGAQPLKTLSTGGPKTTPLVTKAPPFTSALATPLKTSAPATASPPAANSIPPRATSMLGMAQPTKAPTSAGGKVAIAVILAIVAGILLTIIIKRNSTNDENEIYNKVIAEARAPGVTAVTVNQRILDVLLQTAITNNTNVDRIYVIKALKLAESGDGTNVGKIITDFVLTTTMSPEIQLTLIKEVLAKREDAIAAEPLLNFARGAGSVQARAAAIQATRNTVQIEQLPILLSLIERTKSRQLRKAAESSVAGLLDRSPSTSTIAEKLVQSYDSADNDPARFALLRLIGSAGGPQALEIAKRNLNSEFQNDRIAALTSLSNWKKPEALAILLEYMGLETDLSLRARTLDAALKFVSNNPEDARENWMNIADEAKTQDEKVKVIKGLASARPETWSYSIIEQIKAQATDDATINLADRAIKSLKRKAEALSK